MGCISVLFVMAVVCLSVVAHGNSRRVIHFGNMNEIRTATLKRRAIPMGSGGNRKLLQDDGGSFLSSNSDILLINAKRKKKKADEEDEYDVDDDEGSSKLWPPWPFNLIGKKPSKAQDGYPSTGSLFWAYLRQRSRIGVRQIQQLCSELWFHLPPATPPFVLLCAVPLKNGERRIPTLFVNPFARNMALASLGLAVMSWAHAELDRKRLLEPLPIPYQYRDVARAFLPPFLPEDVEPDLELDMTVIDDVPLVTERVTSDMNNEEEKSAEIELPRRLRRHVQYIYDSTPRPQSLKTTLQRWRAKQRSQKARTERTKRMEIYDELVALQHLKKRAEKRRQAGKNRNHRTSAMVADEGDELGYALVTGASRGIGRALAVELARWEIPLILVARDEDRLVSLANDIERCYGVKCCVLPADLSKPDAAAQIYKATTGAGLRVDLLINNAGLSSSGEFVDMDAGSLQNILQVNAMSVASLSHLYGNDMKKRRRGRILIVSSVIGVAYAGPTVAAYAATKSFEKVLGLSMAKELEVYGVGVTCLLPGAVGDSNFRATSGSSQALCWKFPFYVKSCEDVADQGIRALLQGDLETIPGWQNRAFAKVMLPILPQRGLTLITEAAWNPIGHWFKDKKLLRNGRRPAPIVGAPGEDQNGAPPEVTTRTTWSGYMYAPKNPPRIIKIPEASPKSEPEGSTDETALLDSNGESTYPPQSEDVNPDEKSKTDTDEQPEGTQPEGTPPEGTPPAGTPPAGTQPVGTQLEGTQLEGTQPEGTTGSLVDNSEQASSEVEERGTGDTSMEAPATITPMEQSLPAEELLALSEVSKHKAEGYVDDFGN